MTVSVRELEEIAEGIRTVLDRLTDENVGILPRMHRAKMAEAKTQVKDVVNKHIPKLLNWSSKLVGSFEEEERIHLKSASEENGKKPRKK